MTIINESKEYVQYARHVLNGEITACKYIKQAAQRFIDWFSRDDIYFDFDDVDKKIRFIGKMKHSTGKCAGQYFHLLQWQQFCVANIFGWKWCNTNFRVTKKALVFCARKNGKTAFASAISLCCSLVDNEPGAEVDFCANSRQQASLALEQAQNFAESLDPKSKVFKKYRAQIKVPATKSFLQVLSGDSMSNDGYNSSLTVIDEFHAAKDWGMYNVMVSSQGMRTQPLMVIITTAGFLLSPYPLYSMTQTSKEILAGVKTDDTMFNAIYTLDEGDDYTDESVWEKANPSLDQTVERDYLRNQVNDAKNNASLETGILTKNFNLFCQSKDVWLSDNYLLDNSTPIDLSKLKDEICYGGVDLSAVSDITATSIMFPPNPDREYYPDKFIFKTWLYVPQEALETSTNGPLYKDFIHQGYLNMTPGNVVDYDYILKEQLDVSKNHTLMNIAYDNWNSTQWSINATAQGLPLEPFSQALGNFNKPTKYFEILLKQGKVVMDSNPAIIWMFRNVELKYDFNENCKPIKSQGIQTNKIDGVISMLESLGVYLMSPQYSDTLYTF